MAGCTRDTNKVRRQFFVLVVDWLGYANAFGLRVGDKGHVERKQSVKHAARLGGLQLVSAVGGIYEGRDGDYVQDEATLSFAPNPKQHCLGHVARGESLRRALSRTPYNPPLYTFYLTL